MDRSEAEGILAEQERRVRLIAYDDLAALVREPANFDVTGTSGTIYQVEITPLWDDAVGSNLRVIIAVDDGGLRAINPVLVDFVVSPDGGFVGESSDPHQ